MNKSLLKFVTDIGPLLIFFTIYYKNGNDLSLAIPPLIIATIVAVGIVYFIDKKIPYVPLIGGAVVSVFGGLTLYFDNPVFLYIKPTIVNLVFASVLLISKIFFHKNFLKKIFETAFTLDEPGWDKLNFRWAYFFVFLALLNEVVWRTQCPENEIMWVNFKVWGILPLTFVFTALQLPLINKHKV